MKKNTRFAFNAYLQQLARLNGVAVEELSSKFTVEPSVQQTLEDQIQQSAAFLTLINVTPVTEQSGHGVAKGTATSKPRPPPFISGESSMKFVAPEQAPEQAEIIRNTPFWPDVDLSEFRSVMRTDGTVTQPRLKQVALYPARAVWHRR